MESLWKVYLVCYLESYWDLFNCFFVLTLEANHPSLTLGNFGKNGRALDWAVLRFEFKLN